jgi:hypothetical protein
VERVFGDNGVGFTILVRIHPVEERGGEFVALGAVRQG